MCFNLSGTSTIPRDLQRYGKFRNYFRWHCSVAEIQECIKGDMYSSCCFMIVNAM
ncbi:hypothetical protein LEMLEM_LOCUS11017 [Lemmus lemmus]